MSGTFTVVPRAREPARMCVRGVYVTVVHLRIISSASTVDRDTRIKRPLTFALYYIYSTSPEEITWKLKRANWRNAGF